MHVQVHPHALKHGLSPQEVADAWENYLVGAVRVPGELEVRIGLDADGREIELVGGLQADGSWLVFHAMRPPTKRTLSEIEHARKRRQ